MDKPDCPTITEVTKCKEVTDFRTKNGLNGAYSPVVKGDLTGSVEQGSQTPKKMALENVQNISTDLALDIVGYVSHVKTEKPVNRHAVTLRRTVDEVSEKHEILFNSIVMKLEPLCEDSLSQTLSNVFEEMFSDQNYNWGRVVTVYAFGGRLAKHLTDTGRSSLIDTVARSLGVYVGNKLARWILQQGGWVSFH